MTRRVVLLCGPPGSGKTTWALASGLTVYDRDDAKWRDNERAFTAALATLAHPGAQAVVIRSGATRAARARTARLIAATEVRVLDVDPATCKARVAARARDHPPMPAQMAAVDTWWRDYEPAPLALDDW